MFSKLSSFVLNPEKSKGLGQVYVAQPDLKLEKLAGKVFILTEFNDKKKEAENIFNFLISNLEENYYEDEKVLLREKIEDLKVENLFEAAITKTNRDFNLFLQENKIKLKSGQDNITIGLVFEDKLYFSNFGKNRALLIYKQKGSYEMINVETNAFESQNKTKNDVDDIRPVPKIFSSVISGEIPKNAFFLFTSESLPEFISEKEMINVLTKLPPLAAASQIRNILEQINNFVPFFGLVIKSATEIDFSEIEKDYNPANNYQSVPSINQTEKKTEEMLASKGFLNFKKLKNRIKEIQKEKKENEKRESQQKDIVINKNEEIKLNVKENKNIEDKLGIIRSLSSVKKDKQLLKEKFSFKKKTAKIFSFFNKIPLPGKSFISNISSHVSMRCKKRNTAIIGFSLILIFLLLTTSIVITNRQKRATELKEKYDSLVLEIEDKKSSIESDLLYNNYQKAENTLNEMRSLISDFPQESDEEIKYYQELSNLVEENQERIYKITRLNEAQSVININGLGIKDISSIDNNIIALNENGYYSFSANQEIDLENLEITNLNQDYTKFNPQFDLEKENLFFLSSKKLAKLNIANKNIDEYNIEESDLDKNTVAFDTYLNRDKLYLLNPENNNIYTRDKGLGSGNYPQPQTWINDNSDIKTASDIYIDGDIYVLYNNGKIEKFRSGEKQDYPQISINPISSSFSKILEKDGYFYIFDSSLNRLAIIKKDDGSLMGQYIFENLNNPSDYSLGEGGDIFILDGDNIYKYSL